MQKNQDTAVSKKQKRSETEDEGASSDVEMANTQNYFLRLPLEMTTKIMELVQSGDNSLKDALNSRQACRQWNDLIRPNLTFQGTLNDKTIDSLASLDSQLQLKYLVLQRLKEHSIAKFETLGQTSVCLGQLGGRVYNSKIFERSVEHLVIGGDAGCFLRTYNNEEQPFSLSTGFAEDHRALPNIQDSIRGSDLVNLMEHLKDIKVLTLASIAFLSVSTCMLRRLNFTALANLTKLDICIGRKTNLEKLLYFFEKITFPDLASLYIRIYSFSYNFLLYISCLKFISKHPRLKNLSLSQSMANYTVSNPDLNSGILAVQNYPNLEEDLDRIKLDSLRLDLVTLNHPQGWEWTILEQHFLHNQTELRSLDLQVSLRRLHNYAGLHQLLPECSNTLEHFELSSSNVFPLNFDCRALTNFEHLKSCHLYMRDPDPPQEFRYGYHLFTELVEIQNIEQLPPSLTSLHLAYMPGMNDIILMTRQLTNLERISYGGAITSRLNLQPRYLLIFLQKHLHLPNLTEFKVYRYNDEELKNYLNRLPGIFAYIEDDDCFIVHVDRSEFEFGAIQELNA